MSDSNTLDQGLISPKAKTVIVSAVLETVGQVRFGDGTEVALTITEKDLIPTPGGGFVEKVVFSGSKRRGVDRRTIHAIRNQMVRRKNGDKDEGQLFDCYIPELCSECPTCWLYGSVGTVGEAAKRKEYNIKSRVLYASAVSVEPSEIAVAVHNRNAPNELDHRTGEAGIHSEELIKANVHFPTITVLDRVVDWEIGAFAHALLENVNSNRYTAGSARQGGIRFSDSNSSKMIVVDISERGIFPLETAKMPSEETDFAKVRDLFSAAANLDKIKEAFKNQGFDCNEQNLEEPENAYIKDESSKDTDQSKANSKSSTNKSIKISRDSKPLWIIDEVNNVITVKQVQDNQTPVLMTRYVGERAYGFLRERQEDWRHFLEVYTETAWKQTLDEITTKLRLKEATALPEEVVKLIESRANKKQVKEALKKARLKTKEEANMLIVSKGKQELARLIVEADETVKMAEGVESEASSEEEKGG